MVNRTSLAGLAAADEYRLDGVRVPVGLAPGETVRNLEADGCTFTGEFERARLVNCTFIECTFDGANLAQADLTDTRFVGCKFTGCKLLAVSWGLSAGWGIASEPVVFEHCRLDYSCFDGLDMAGAVLRHCSAVETHWTETDLRRAVLAGCDLTGARFAGSDLRDADLRGCTGLAFDVRDCRVRGLRVDPDAAQGLLSVFGIEVVWL